jgi:hypothetical protein
MKGQIHLGGEYLRKGFGIAVVLALAMMLVPGAVFAGDPINVSTTWSGSGSVGGTVTAGSTLATTNWGSTGNIISGTFTANYNVGGGPYGGNSYTTSIDADVANGGWIQFATTRGALGYTGGGTDELGGQQSYSYVFSSDGTASMSTRTAADAVFTKHTGVNTGLLDNTYGWVSENFRVSGTSYQILREMLAANGNFVQASAIGSGTAALDTGAQRIADSRTNQADLAYRSGYNFGWNQDFTATGTGQLVLTAVGSNQVFMYNISNTGADPGTSGGSWNGALSITSGTTYLAGQGLTATGNGTLGSAALQIITGFVSGTLTYPNVAMTAQ